ncbi:MAG: alanine--tRNA ligase [Candidatus Krumholzibacteria bacterium]
MIGRPKKKTKVDKPPTRGTTDRMKQYSAEYLAESFLEYYRQLGHTVVASAPLVPEDPTLLFTAAGMVPFKSYYSDPTSAPYARAASVQKCLRAGGKQSDLENVGRTLRHHTFFEMLGNFSFGDYFKKEAIDTAWDLSVNVWKIDKKRIWVSVYEDDDEAHELWAKRIGLPTKRIVRLGKSDNFWGPVGDTGVCGPSSELYFDTGAKRGCARDSCRPGCDCERFIEYWNLVFPQFFLSEGGDYDPLPKPGIDTGMGLERVAFILQRVEDNFHTDLFLPLRTAVKNALPGIKSSEHFELAVNAAADHVRALVFALSEGIYPSNDGRGYVLRRLLRRAVTKMHPFGVKKPFLSGAVDAVVDVMGGRYPELHQHRAGAKQIITAEEEHFLSTIEQGWNKLQEVIESSRKRESRSIAGKDAFVLYDTYGFPLELTAELAVDAGLTVDEKGYRVAMEEQRERSRKHYYATRTGGKRAGPGRGAEKPFVDVPGVATTAEDTEFIGYEELACEATLGRYRVPGEDVVEITTDRTVFYPVGGGQVGDSGSVIIDDERIDVVDAFREGGGIVHVLHWQNRRDDDPGKFLGANAAVRLQVDREVRFATARNHTGTHLLHKALREVLGDHVAQAGSLVAPGRLRFDFKHFRAIGADDLSRVEQMVNGAVLDDLAVTYEDVPYRQAIADGAMALFGEKYGDIVRVVSIEDFSRELCGGTHLKHTGEIGAFVITHETAVAAGVRRIEALTGRAALGYFRKVLDEQAKLALALKVSPGDLERRIRALQDENEALKKKLEERHSEQAAGELDDALEKAQDIGGIALVTFRSGTADLAALRRSGDHLRDRMDRGVALLCAGEAKKPIVLIVASDRLVKEKEITANRLARLIGAEFSLRGGGKDHMAQLGVRGPDEFDPIVSFVQSWLRER